jgi:hypothetical protein
VEDSYFSRYGATKAMVFAAIGCLKANEVVPKPPPSLRWFQEFMSKHEDLFKTLQTKPIAQVRVSAADFEEVLYKNSSIASGPGVRNMESNLGMY